MLPPKLAQAPGLVTVTAMNLCKKSKTGLRERREAALEPVTSVCPWLPAWHHGGPESTWCPLKHRAPQQGVCKDPRKGLKLYKDLSTKYPWGTTQILVQCCENSRGEQASGEFLLQLSVGRRLTWYPPHHPGTAEHRPPHIPALHLTSDAFTCLPCFSSNVFYLLW